MLRCGKSVRGSVGCVRKCVRVWVKLWESVLGCGSGEKRCGEAWGRHGKLQHLSQNFSTASTPPLTLLHSPYTSPTLPDISPPHPNTLSHTPQTSPDTFLHLPPHPNTLPHTPYTSTHISLYLTHTSTPFSIPPSKLSHTPTLFHTSPTL